MGPNFPAGDHEIECMFNPTEYRLSQTLNVHHNRATAQVGGTPEFSGTNAMTLTTQLFFDDFASAKGDVTPKITTLLSWTHPTEDSTNNGQPCPPLVKFVWGGNPQLDTFFGFLRSVSVNYTVFRIDGTPIQAKVDIQIVGLPEAVRAAEPDLAGDERAARPHDDRRRHASSRSRSRSSASRPTGARSPSSTTSTTRCASRPGRRS